VSLHIVVVGTPRPQGSKRPVRNKHTGRIHMVESSERLPDWRADIRDAALKLLDPPDNFARLWEAPLVVGIQFRLARPKGHYLPVNSRREAPELRPEAPRHPAGKPDTDKLIRAVLDALTGLVWRDDSQVVHIEAWKLYHPHEGADITVSEAL
jgi:Holliday junction resolvase RusA-like endonuclease